MRQLPNNDIPSWTFVEFQKHDFIDRESLVNIITEFSLDPKTKNIIQSH